MYCAVPHHSGFIYHIYGAALRSFPTYELKLMSYCLRNIDDDAHNGDLSCFLAPPFTVTLCLVFNQTPLLINCLTVPFFSPPSLSLGSCRLMKKADWCSYFKSGLQVSAVDLEVEVELELERKVAPEILCDAEMFFPSHPPPLAV